MLYGLMLVLISTSLTAYTLHSHHPWHWNRTNQHANTGHQITQDTTLCPICGYLFSANHVDISPMVAPEILTGFVVTLPEVRHHNSFTGYVTGRSPPVA